MAKDYLRQSALAHLHLEALGVDDPGAAGVSLCERPFRGQLALRGNSADHEFVEGVQGVLGTRFCTCTIEQVNIPATHTAKPIRAAKISGEMFRQIRNSEQLTTKPAQLSNHSRRVP